MAAQAGGLLGAVVTGLATSSWQAHAGERIALVFGAMTAIEIALCQGLLVLEPGDPPAAGFPG